MAATLAERAGGKAAAVLFYGSNLRNAALEGVLDFYVLVDRVDAWPGNWLTAFANRCLPPNVGYWEAIVDGELLRAKIAVITLAQFRAGMTVNALDTTLWARFSQPSACVFARSTSDRDAVTAAARDALLTASRWAALLGPPRGTAYDYWRALYRRTYEAELRVEGEGRGADLVVHDPDRYARLLPLAWEEAGIGFTPEPNGQLHPELPQSERQSAERSWKLRRRIGKPLNLLRLAKATFTFDNAMDYVAWKVERQSGQELKVKPWQRRHPLLAAPGVYLQLRKRGIL
jgi:hypothetical protein